jgi:regulator of protease activity HflC (stomatin/prohibitin superfamily)
VQGLFIGAIILALIAVGLFALSRILRSAPGATDGDRFAVKVIAWFFAAGTAVTLLFCSYNPVGAREIGVVTLAGSLEGHTGPGPNFLPPWDNLTTIDDSYQLTDETFTVRIAGGQTAQATVQVRWNAVEAAADEIYGNYKTTNGMEKGLLDPEVNVATNTVLGGYSPLDALATGAKAGTTDNPSTAQLGARIEAVLKGRVGDVISVRTFNLKPLVYDAAVQAQINAATNQAAKTIVANEAVKTAAAQAAANKALEVNLATNPLVLVQQCFTAIASGEFKPPAGFSCWPGQGSGVVIPSSGK